MLADDLAEIHEELSKTLFHYTSTAFKNAQEIDVIFEVQDIMNRIEVLRDKLWDSDFKGNYRFNSPGE